VVRKYLQKEIEILIYSYKLLEVEIVLLYAFYGCSDMGFGTPIKHFERGLKASLIFLKIFFKFKRKNFLLFVC
jgi:hypothetical protein